MKNVAIISPGILPVPATKGGAVESLLTFLLEENEKVEEMQIDLFSIESDAENVPKYLKSNIYTIHKTTFVKNLDRVADKIYRTVPWQVSAKRFFDNSIVSKFREILVNAEYSYDIIVIENQMSLANKLIDSGLTKGSRVFFHMHNDIDIYRSPQMCQKLSNCGVTFIAVSEFIKNRIIKYAPKAEVRVLYNGTDTDVFNIELIRKKDAVRSELGIESGEIVFLFSGRIIPEKGVMELIEAFNAFLSKCPDVKARLMIVGLNDIPTKYESQIVDKCWKSGENITCHGRVNSAKMAELVAASDVLVIPTVIEEAFCMAATEAMAMGKPIIATRSGAIPELLTEENAIIVPKDDGIVPGLSEAMCRLTDADLRKRMGNNSYRIFANREDWHKDYFYRNFSSIVGANDEH